MMTEFKQAISPTRDAGPHHEAESLNVLLLAIEEYARKEANRSAYIFVKTAFFSRGVSEPMTYRYMAAITGWYRRVENTGRHINPVLLRFYLIEIWQSIGVNSLLSAYNSVRKRQNITSSADSLAMTIVRNLLPTLEARFGRVTSAA